METRVVFDGTDYRIIDDERGLASSKFSTHSSAHAQLPTYELAFRHDIGKRFSFWRISYAQIHPLLLMKELHED